jgi:uncharacterized protein YceH (UPF0502 family)
MSAPGSERAWVPLTPRERRVLGVLVEKAKTTPEYYPLTLAAIVTGCNQKSNRDPVTNYEPDDVEETLQELRRKGAVVLVEAGGRVARWKHTLYDWLSVSNVKVGKVELAVICELLLRGAQTEGDLRARASRMEPIADLPALQALLDALAARGLVTYLSPPGQKRGVVVAHALYPPAEAEKVRQAYLQSAAASDEEERPARLAGVRAEAAAVGPPAWAAENAAIRAEVQALRVTVETLADELRELKRALGV